MYNMSDSQKSIYLVEKVYPHTGICNIGGLLCFAPGHDADILKLSCENIVKSNSNFWLKVAESGKVYFEQPECIDIAAYDFSDVDDDKVKTILSEWMSEPLYDINKYLYDIRMVHMKSSLCIFVKAHHLIADGFSVALFTKKITEIYKDILSDCYVYCDDTGYMDKIINESDCNENGIFNVKSERQPLFGKKSYDPKANLIHRDFVIPDNELKKYLKNKHTGTEILVCAALVKYLSAVYTPEVIHIGRSVVNRRGDEYRTFGMFVKTDCFAYRSADYDGIENIDEYLQQIRQQFKRISANVDPLGGNSFDVIISYRPYKLMESLADGECTEIHNGFSEAPLKLFIKENAQGTCIEYVYQKEIFSETDIVRLADRIDHIIKQIVNEEVSCVGDINICDETDISFISKYNDTKRPVETKSLLEKFEENVFLYPDKTALIYEDEQYSYKEIYDMIHKTMVWLQKNMRKDREKIAAVSLARSMWHPIVLYAIWKAGFAYLPVSIHNSPERNKSIYEKCAAVIDINVIEEIMRCSNTADTVVLNGMDLPDSIAYYMFTSGTTGEPKAVAISHSSLNERISWMADTFSDGIDAIMHKTNNSFDVSMWELALSFAYGKTLCIAGEGEEKNPQRLAELIEKENITMMHFVPSMFRAFIKYVENNRYKLNSLRYIILSGERLDAATVKRAGQLFENAKICNLYGPTECTIDVSYYECMGNEDIIPIGKPVWNTELYVCNKWGQPLPVGEKGELVVKGSLLGEYSGVFSKNTSGGFKYISGEKCYFTGDIASLSLDGYMYFHGRKDSQIKIRGMRVNISELETVLNNAFTDCTHVILKESDRLIDFYEGNAQVPDIEKVIDEKFQYYYKPSRVIKVKRLPVNENGKVDREALLEKYYCSEDAFETDEKQHTEVWEIDRIVNILIRCAKKYVKGNLSAADNLAYKGIDSLSIINYLTDIKQYGLEVSYDIVIKAKNIHEFAGYIYNYSMDTKREELVYLNENQASELILAVPFAGGTPLSFMGLRDAINKMKYDIAVVNTASLIDMSVSEISEKICTSLEAKNYAKIHIISSCVGSSIAIDISSKLSDKSASLTLCESLPYTGMKMFGKTYTVWDMMPALLVEKILQIIRGKPLKMDLKMLLQFRKDVRKSAEWLRTAKNPEITCPISVIYGTKDLLTKGYNKRYKKWNRYIQSKHEMKVYEVEAAGHFLVEDYGEEVCEILKL